MAKVVKFNEGEVYTYDAIWDRSIAEGRCAVITGKEGDKALQDYHRDSLLALIKPKDTVYTVMTHSTNSGVQHFKVLINAVSPEGRPYIRNITRMMAKLNGNKLNKDADAIVMSGYGYSKSFQIVYGLGCMLWPHGTKEPHGMRNGVLDRDGGYALQQQGL